MFSKVQFPDPFAIKLKKMPLSITIESCNRISPNDCVKIHVFKGVFICTSITSEKCVNMHMSRNVRKRIVWHLHVVMIKSPAHPRSVQSLHYTY